LRNVLPPLTFARVRGRAVSRLPRSTCWSLAFPTGPPRDSSSPTATSWTLVPGRVPESFESGSPPHPLRRLRRSGRIRSTSTDFSASVLPLLELFVLLGPLFRVTPETSTPARRRFRSVLPRLGRSLCFGRKMPLFRRVPPSWFLPPRRFAPFLASSMLQLAPDLGFARLVPRRSLALRRSFDLRSTSDRAWDDPVRLALRRFAPRR